MNIDLKEMPKEITTLVYPCVHPKYGWLSLRDDPPEYSDYVQIGDPVEMTFKLLGSNEVLTEVVTVLKEEQSKLRAESERKCMDIEEKIQSLLALPNPDNDHG